MAKRFGPDGYLEPNFVRRVFHEVTEPSYTVFLPSNLKHDARQLKVVLTDLRK